MNLNLLTKHKVNLLLFLVGLIIVVLTFSTNDWSYSPGTDPPLSWLYNYIFDVNLQLGKDIVFPHGPLGIVMYPLPQNIICVTLFISLIKIVVVFNFYQLIKHHKKWLYVVCLVFIYFLAIYGGILLLLLTNIILCYCNYFTTSKSYYKILALLLTAISIYIKSYLAVITCIIFISFFIYNIICLKNIKKNIVDVCILFLFTIIIWVLMYRQLTGIVNYFIGLYQLSQDNSSAASFYPNNNWYLLSLFILLFIALLSFKNSKKSLFYNSIIALSVFAAWKHGMARQDMVHYPGFIYYIITILFIYLLFIGQHYLYKITLSVLSVLFLILNTPNCYEYQLPSYPFYYGENFIEFMFNFNSLKKQAQSHSEINISIKKLPQAILDSIKNETVDVYPWDYSIIPANKLNWKPRPVIQSYASYTSWLDNKNAVYFNSNIKPTFLIIDKIKGPNNNEFSSIDNRYFFNDEPNSIIEILANYSYYFSNEQVLILKLNNTHASKKIVVDNYIESKFNTWINVPKNTASLQRVKLKFDKSFLQLAKSFLYKDEQFWIYLKLENNVIHKYRIVPKNAEDGIWLNPYITNTKTHQTVKQIYFTSSNPSLITNSILLQFNYINFNNQLNAIPTIFNTKLNNDSLLTTSLNNFEKSFNTNWTLIDSNYFTNNCNTGKKGYVLKANSYSPAYEILLDTLNADSINVNFELYVNSEKNENLNKISSVISIKNNTETFVWNGANIGYQIINDGNWNIITNSIYFCNKSKNTRLSCYVWNTSTNDILIDDFEVRIHKCKKN